jgi:hypothetical protein
LASHARSPPNNWCSFLLKNWCYSKLVSLVLLVVLEVCTILTWEVLCWLFHNELMLWWQLDIISYFTTAGRLLHECDIWIPATLLVLDAHVTLWLDLGPLLLLKKVVGALVWLFLILFQCFVDSYAIEQTKNWQSLLCL